MTDFKFNEPLEFSNSSDFKPCHDGVFDSFAPEDDLPYRGRAFEKSDTIQRWRYARRPHPDIRPGQPFLGFKNSIDRFVPLILEFFDSPGVPVDAVDYVRWPIWKPLQNFDYTKPYDIRKVRPCQTKTAQLA